VIASLNYDNAIELAAEAEGVSCYTGIEDWSEHGEVRLPPLGVALLKLHGSIDWREKGEPATATRPLDHRTFQRVAPEVFKHYGFWPAVIFGQRNKLTASGPFLDFLRTFRDELFAAERLTVVGYSFRDMHVNEYIRQWVNRGGEWRIRIIDPAYPTTQIPFAQDIGRIRGRVEHVAGTAKEAIGRLV